MRRKRTMLVRFPDVPPHKILVEPTDEANWYRVYVETDYAQRVAGDVVGDTSFRGESLNFAACA